MRVTDELAKAIVFCHDAGDECPHNCPDYRKDVCAFGLSMDFPTNREKDLAADLLEARTALAKARGEA